MSSLEGQRAARPSGRGLGWEKEYLYLFIITLPWVPATSEWRGREEGFGRGLVVITLLSFSFARRPITVASDVFVVFKATRCALASAQSSTPKPLVSDGLLNFPATYIHTYQGPSSLLF